MGWEIAVFATAADGRRVQGRVTGDGHPAYRSTPEMIVAMANVLADGTLGRTPHVGIVTPASGLGIEAVAALRTAGVRFGMV